MDGRDRFRRRRLVLDLRHRRESAHALFRARRHRQPLVTHVAADDSRDRPGVELGSRHVLHGLRRHHDRLHRGGTARFPGGRQHRQVRTPSLGGSRDHRLHPGDSRPGVRADLRPRLLDRGSAGSARARSSRRRNARQAVRRRHRTDRQGAPGGSFGNRGLSFPGIVRRCPSTDHPGLHRRHVVSPRHQLPIGNAPRVGGCRWNRLADTRLPGRPAIPGTAGCHAPDHRSHRGGRGSLDECSFDDSRPQSNQGFLPPEVARGAEGSRFHAGVESYHRSDFHSSARSALDSRARHHVFVRSGLVGDVVPVVPSHRHVPRRADHWPTGDSSSPLAVDAPVDGLVAVDVLRRSGRDGADGIRRHLLGASGCNSDRLSGRPQRGAGPLDLRSIASVHLGREGFARSDRGGCIRRRSRPRSQARSSGAGHRSVRLRHQIVRRRNRRGGRRSA